MYKDRVNMLGIKLPRKFKKVYMTLDPSRSYKRIFKKMSYSFNTKQKSTIYKILDYMYCYDNASSGYKAGWPEIVNHRLYKAKQAP